MVLIKSSHIFFGLSLFASLLSVRADLQQDVCDRVNQERAKVGCKPVTIDSRLTEVAKKHNDFMVSSKQLTHDDPSGDLGSRFEQCGYDFSSAGENVAEGFSSDDAQGVMDAWMNSAGHRDNILNPDFCNMGCVCGGGFCTQDFGNSIGGSSDNSDNSDNSSKSHKSSQPSDNSDDSDNSDNSDNVDSGNTKKVKHITHHYSHKKVSSNDVSSDNDVPSNDDSDNDDDSDNGDVPSDVSDPVDDDTEGKKPKYKEVHFGKKPCPKKQ